MDKNKSCTICNIKLDEDNFKKDRTISKDCYNKKKRKYNKKSEKVSVNDEHINIRTILVGPSFSVKTYLMLKILSRKPDRDTYIITKSPPEQYSKSKIRIKEISEEIQPLNEYENAIMIFDDNLGSTKRRYIDQFFIRGRHNILDIYYLSESNFDLPKRTMRNKSNKIILFNQTLKDKEYI